MYLCNNLHLNSFCRCLRVCLYKHLHSTQISYFPRRLSRNKKDSNFENNQLDDNPCVETNVAIKNINENFYGVDSDEGVTYFNEQQNKDSFQNNFSYKLNNSYEENNIHIKRFGSVRYDSSLKPGNFTDTNAKLYKDFDYIDKPSDIQELSRFSSSHETKSKRKGIANDNPVAVQKELLQTGTSNVFQNVKEVLSTKSHLGSKSNVEPLKASYPDKEYCFIDQMYFNHKINENEPSLKSEPLEESIACFEKSIKQDKSPQSSFFDEHYFNELMDSSSNEAKNVKMNASLENNEPEELKSADKSNFIQKDTIKLLHENYFTDSSDAEVSGTPGDDINWNNKNLPADVSETYKISNVKQTDKNLDNLKKLDSLHKNAKHSSELSKLNVTKTKRNRKPKLSESKEIRFSNQTNNDSSNSLFVPEKVTNQELDHNTKNKIDDEKELSTAHDFVKELRSEDLKCEPELKNKKMFIPKEKLDSKGFRILKYQVPSLMYFTRDEILNILKNNILYSDDNVLVLNKPYNLVMHESQTTKEPCLSEYLDDLAAALDRYNSNPKLFTVHRLDKETTGCLLLARNETTALHLKSLFSQRKILKTYWIVTIRVPDPLEGAIDIPISEGTVEKRSRMVLHPNLDKDVPFRNHSKSGRRAVTEYKVMATSGNAALIEVRPVTGIKHQIRVHFGFGLSCPILGDHKYSYLDKLVPQKLSNDLLQRLGVRQSKVRHIPMHIFARTVLIPQYNEGRNLFVTSPMPLHMSKNLQSLKFRKK